MEECEENEIKYWTAKALRFECKNYSDGHMLNFREDLIAFCILSSILPSNIIE